MSRYIIAAIILVLVVALPVGVGVSVTLNTAASMLSIVTAPHHTKGH